MAARKKGLGKGLDALLGPVSAAQVMQGTGANALRVLPVDLLQRGPWQPRADFDQAALQELADSIKAQGVLQPIMARPLGAGDKFEIIAGERRWRAAQLAGLHEIPAVVRELDDQAAMCVALIENMQREDLNPLEQARGLARLSDEFGMTHEAVAEAVGRSRPAVTNLLRLLQLDAETQRLLAEGKLEMGHARPLLTLPADKQREAARLIVKSGLSARAAEALAKRMAKTGEKGTSGGGAVDPNIQSLAAELSERLGAAVSVQHQKSGKGALRIAYSSLAQLDGILARLRGKQKNER